MQFGLDNNGIHIGVVNAFSGNVKKFMVIAALGFAVFTTVGCHSEKEASLEISAEVNELPDYTYSYEPRYSGIKYEVKWGDTLSEIVAAYESDYNRILKYVDEIIRINKLGGILREGITIELVGVPESKLADYGYTSDYNVIGNDVFVEDAYEWLLEERQWIVESERNQEAVDKFNIDFTEFVNQYNAYLREENETLKQEKLDSLVELLNDVLEQFKKITGLDFSKYHKAYPIPDTPDYQNYL